MTRLTLQLDAPIQSVRVLNNHDICSPVSQTQTITESQTASIQVNSLCSALQQAIADFQRLHENLFISHKEQIVRLSVEIARKILAKDIQERNYEIEKIVADALTTIEVSGDITIRLNPEDLKCFQNSIESKNINLPEKAVFVDDPAVNCGECIIDTNDGIVEYLIHEHLSMIENALLDMHTQIEQI